MVNESITVINKFGLHTRAAAKLVSLCSKFESKIQLQLNERIADCKSIMSVILLGVTQGMTLTLIISGADELEAHADIAKLFNNRFNELE